MPNNTTDTSEIKTCAKCGETKPVAEFYFRFGKPYSACKECVKQKSREYERLNTTATPNNGEATVIDELWRQGIYAANGRAAPWRYVDVIAWGCVRIEVKTSHPYYPKHGISLEFQFGMGSNRRKDFDNCDIVIMLARWEDGDEFYIFPADHPVFRNAKGDLKYGISWRPFANHRKITPWLCSNEVMEAHRDNWGIIEEYRRNFKKIIEAKPGELRTTSRPARVNTWYADSVYPVVKDYSK